MKWYYSTERAIGISKRLLAVGYTISELKSSTIAKIVKRLTETGSFNKDP